MFILQEPEQATISTLIDCRQALSLRGADGDEAIQNLMEELNEKNYILIHHIF